MLSRALPHTYREVHRPDGTGIALTISGEAGGRWSILSEDGRWNLYRGAPQPVHAEVVIAQDVAWRLFTKGVSRAEAQSSVSLLGDRELGSVVLDMVSIIA